MVYRKAVYSALIHFIVYINDLLDVIDSSE